MLRDLGRSVERVGRRDGGAAVGGSEEGEGELRTVLEEEHDYVALFYAEVVEAGGDSAGGELDIGVGEGLTGVGVDQAGMVSELGQVFEAVSVQWEVVWNVSVGQFGTENEFVM